MKKCAYFIYERKIMKEIYFKIDKKRKKEGLYIKYLFKKKYKIFLKKKNFLSLIDTYTLTYWFFVFI